jgi:predicted permease
MSLGGDVRVALRGLRRQPGWATTAIVTLALGIGANATMFGIVDRLLLSAPPHIAGPARVMRVGLDRAQGGGGRFTMSTASYPDFTDVAGSGAFASVTGISDAEMVLGTGSDARPVSAVKATGDYFTVLGTKPLIGRFFARDEDAAPAGAPVAVISSAFWRRAFGGSDTVLGRRIILDNASFTVIGVAPADFTGDGLAPVDLWVPLSSAMDGQEWRTTRAMLLVRIVGRLRDGAPAGLAAEQASVALRRGAVGSPYADSTTRAVLTSVAPGWQGMTPAGTEGRIALWLAGMSAVVLLIAVVNVANLMLLRARQRRREVAVRLALGAPRWRLARGLAIEAALVLSSGGAAALAVAAWGGEWVRLILLPGLAGQEQLISGRLLLFTGLGTVAAGLLAALVPVLRAGRVSVTADLTAGGGTGQGAPRLASGLLILQAALSVILLAGAGAFSLSLHRVRTQDFGFKPEGILFAQMSFPPALPGYASDRAVPRCRRPAEPDAGRGAGECRASRAFRESQRAAHRGAGTTRLPRPAPAGAVPQSGDADLLRPDGDAHHRGPKLHRRRRRGLAAGGDREPGDGQRALAGRKRAGQVHPLRFRAR